MLASSTDPQQLQIALRCKLAGCDVFFAVEDARHGAVIPKAPLTVPSAETASGYICGQVVVAAVALLLKYYANSFRYYRKAQHEPFQACFRKANGSDPVRAWL